MITFCISENDKNRVRIMHSAHDRAPTEHHHGLHQGDGAGQGAAGGVRAARAAAAGQKLHLLWHGQGRRACQLISPYNNLQFKSSLFTNYSMRHHKHVFVFLF